jgi:hypothetical protein
MRRGIIRGGDQIYPRSDDMPILHYDCAEGPALPRADILNGPPDRFPHENIVHTSQRTPSAQSANCTGKNDPAVYAFVMCLIAFMHCDLRLDFREFACKI